MEGLCVAERVALPVTCLPHFCDNMPKRNHLDGDDSSEEGSVRPLFLWGYQEMRSYDFSLLLVAQPRRCRFRLFRSCSDRLHRHQAIAGAALPSGRRGPAHARAHGTRHLAAITRHYRQD